jgi:putative membrane protein
MAWHTADAMGWWMPFGGLLWFAFWGTLIYFAASLFRGRIQAPANQLDDSVEIAKHRYARGEIGRDEYERLRHDLAA